MEVEMKEETKEVESSFRILGSCFSKDGGQQEDIKMRVGEGQKTFRVKNIIFNVRSTSLGVRRGLHHRKSTPTVTYGAETLALRTDEGYKLGILKLKCLRSMCVVTRIARWRNGEVRHRVGVKKNS